MDTLKTNLEYRNYLRTAWWDMIVIDECHNVAARAREQGLSRRARLAQLLAERSDSLILLSATPHDGSARSFASLVSLLDPTAISNPDDYTRDDFRDKGLVIRRFKKDIKDQVASDFQERIVVPLRKSASPAEEATFEALLEVPFTQSGQHRAGRQQELQRIGMQKAMFSSPFAALESTRNRIRVLDSKPNASDDEAKEVRALRVLEDRLCEINDTNFSKYQRLLAYLQSEEFGWDRRSAHDRLVIFSERLETLRWLKNQLTADLHMRANEVETLEGQMSDTEQQGLVERFSRLDDPIRLLLCSDVASEGLNLHYFCHRLIHFDLPWSLMIFQQRNGRVDRYGQKERPQIVYLFTDTVVDKIKGDLRILEILQEKDDQAVKNLGDPATVLKAYDPELETAKVSDLMARGLSAEQVEAELDASAAEVTEGDGDWLLSLFEGSSDELSAGDSSTSSLDHIGEPISLFDSDYDFARTALTNLSRPEPIAQWKHDDESRTIWITAPKDLENRLRQLPREVQADMYVLTADKSRMAQAIEEARQTKSHHSDDPEKEQRNEASTWPQIHYLWPQHPIMEWLADRVLTAFGRYRAPVIQSSQLAADEQAYILMAMIPNRKAQPLLVEWQVASRRGAGPFTLESFDSFVKRAGLKAHQLPNPAKADLAALQSGVPGAVHAMRCFMVERQGEFASLMSERLQKTLEELQLLQKKQIDDLNQRIAQMELALHFKQSRLNDRTREIHGVFDEYRSWVEETMTTEPQPFIQLLAAISR